MARKYGQQIAIFAVSPGSNLDTNAARHVTGFNRILYTKIMLALGPFLGMSQPIPVGAKRYVDVLNDVAEITPTANPICLDRRSSSGLWRK